MRIHFTILLLLIAVLSHSQESLKKKSKAYKMANAYKGADPYKGKPFRPGEIKTMKLSIPVGKIMISNDITYKLLADEDGKAYRANHAYRAFITKVTPTEKDTATVPRSVAEGFLYRNIDLTEQQIMSDQVVTSKIEYFFSVEDFNLDGKPDFAFIGNKHYHPYPVKNYVWVNINGKLVYWYGLSNVSSDKENVRSRMLSIIATTKTGGIYARYFNVVKDTILVPFKGKR